jgi:hypothetical protein
MMKKVRGNEKKEENFKKVLRKGSGYEKGLTDEGFVVSRNVNS